MYDVLRLTDYYYTFASSYKAMTVSPANTKPKFSPHSVLSVAFLAAFSRQMIWLSCAEHVSCEYTYVFTW